MNCRSCDTPLADQLVDLGSSPLSNRFLGPEELDTEEQFWPLCVKVCSECRLVQLDEFESPGDIFNDSYAYYSSYSPSWLAHACEYVDEIVGRLGLNSESWVVEVASNDGYLLRNFVDRGIKCLGVEPAANVAEAARRIGVPTEEHFFGQESAKLLLDENGTADLIIANNVLAHVPDLHDFLGGFKILLGSNGIASFEFPHLLELLRHTQFDTIYHEHFSYLSLFAIEPLLSRHGLMMTDVQKLQTHGGSLRLFVGHAGRHEASSRVAEILSEEMIARLHTDEAYIGFQDRVNAIRDMLLTLLNEASDQGRLVAGYGAAAKGNTLLNYCNIRSDLLPWIADASPRKQGCYTPGTHIPIVSPDRFKEEPPDDVLILPWNLREEIAVQLHCGEHVAPERLIVPIPTPGVYVP